MSRQYSIAEARASLSAIIDQAESGQQIELTRRGKPVALVISLDEFARLQGNRPQFGEAYGEFLQTHSLSELGLNKGYFEATRSREQGRNVTL